MAINPISSGAFAPSSSPAALLSFFCSIVFRQPEEQTSVCSFLLVFRHKAKFYVAILIENVKIISVRTMQAYR